MFFFKKKSKYNLNIFPRVFLNKTQTKAFQMYLKSYYENRFPYSELCNLIGRQNESYSSKESEQEAEEDDPLYGREFAFHYYKKDANDKSDTADTGYNRHITYSNVYQFMASTVRTCPPRIEVGAIHVNNDTRNSPFKDKEFCIDIDMDEYDAIRSCCQGKRVCRNCWGYIISASYITKHFLQHMYGVDNALWVFSGRRGIHVWVFDFRADYRTALKKRCSDVNDVDVTYISPLTEKERYHIIDNMRIFEYCACKDEMECSKYYAQIKSYDWMLKLLSSYMVEMFVGFVIEAQLIFSDEPHEDGQTKREAFLSKIPDFIVSPKQKRRALKKWKRCAYKLSDTRAWEKLVKIADEQPRNDALPSLSEYAAMYYLHPRFDLAVSVQSRHLIKLPFCVHHKTGNVCYPMEFDSISRFNPTDGFLKLETLMSDNVLSETYYQLGVMCLNKVYESLMLARSE